VSYFHDALTNFLIQKTGLKETVIWRDEEMEPDAFIDESIFDNLLRSLTLVSVVTPLYVSAPYCLAELEKFYTTMRPIGNRSRVFKVVKTPVELKEMPEIFRKINGIDFYKTDKKTKKTLEFAVDDFGPESTREFFLRVSDLALEIAGLLKTIPATNPPPPEKVELKPTTAPVLNKTAVYLAETSEDFQKERDNIRRDLLDQGFEVLPPCDAVAPPTTEEYKKFVREYIQKCSLAVHLIGRNYGEGPGSGKQSYIHLQSIVAAERDSDPNFHRIVWLPKGVNSNEPSQRQFLKDIWASTVDGVEVLDKPLEEMKNNILDALERAAKPAPTPKRATAKPSIFVFFDKVDTDAAVTVESHIKDSGFSVWSAAKYLSKEPVELIRGQNEFLLNCDAVIIYRNKAPDFWTQISLDKLQKIFGEGREDDFLGEAVFVGKNSTSDDIEADVEILASFEELDVFLEAVRNEFQERFNGRARK